MGSHTSSTKKTKTDPTSRTIPRLSQRLSHHYESNGIAQDSIRLLPRLHDKRDFYVTGDRFAFPFVISWRDSGKRTFFSSCSVTLGLFTPDHFNRDKLLKRINGTTIGILNAIKKNALLDRLQPSTQSFALSLIDELAMNDSEFTFADPIPLALRLMEDPFIRNELIVTYEYAKDEFGLLDGGTGGVWIMRNAEKCIYPDTAVYLSLRASSHEDQIAQFHVGGTLCYFRNPARFEIDDNLRGILVDKLQAVTHIFYICNISSFDEEIWSFQQTKNELSLKLSLETWAKLTNEYLKSNRNLQEAQFCIVLSKMDCLREKLRRREAQEPDGKIDITKPPFAGILRSDSSRLSAEDLESALVRSLKTRFIESASEIVRRGLKIYGPVVLTDPTVAPRIFCDFLQLQRSIDRAGLWN